MRSKLLTQLLAHDRKATAPLERISEEFGSGPDYAAALIDLSASEHPQVASGATWLLRAHLQTEGPLPARLTADLIHSLEHIETWDAQLHICQLVSKLTVPADCADVLYAWLEHLITHERPFVRAWSIDAICQLALQHDTYANEAKHVLKRATDDPAASVRARVRNLQKSLQH